jgi:hypothetical protein
MEDDRFITASFDVRMGEGECYSVTVGYPDYEITQMHIYTDWESMKKSFYGENGEWVLTQGIEAGNPIVYYNEK